MPRKYEPIWQRIKLEGKCTIAAHPLLHARIKKAVSKEKYGDTVYKLEWDLKDLPQPELKITTDPKQPNQIQFELVTPISLESI